MKTIILIPARMQATRLPGKPLADIGGIPMVVRVAKQAQAAAIGRVVIAGAEAEIIDAASRHNIEAVLTDPDLPSGTDRIWAGLHALPDASSYDTIINLQGDLPLIDPESLKLLLTAHHSHQADITTPVVRFSDVARANNPNIVKVAASIDTGQTHGRALYFSRAPIPYSENHHAPDKGEWPRTEWLYHVGIYAYTRQALERFVNLPPSPLELREKLEQLRALEAGMLIGVSEVTAIPQSVDTEEDLAVVRQLIL